MFMKSDIISEHFVLKNRAIISYYKDRHVWRHWQYIELIPTAPFKKCYTDNKHFNIGGCALVAI